MNEKKKRIKRLSFGLFFVVTLIYTVRKNAHTNDLQSSHKLQSSPMVETNKQRRLRGKLSCSVSFGNFLNLSLPEILCKVLLLGDNDMKLFHRNHKCEEEDDDDQTNEDDQEDQDDQDDEEDQEPSLMLSEMPSNHLADVPSPTTPTSPTFNNIKNFSCPDYNQEPLEFLPDPQETSISLVRVSDGENLCTLTLKSFKSADNVATTIPIGRSYNGNDWEVVAGPHKQNIKFTCDEEKCDLDYSKVSTLTPNPSERLVLTSFSINDVKPDITNLDVTARFLEQTTFGPTDDTLLQFTSNSKNVNSKLDDEFSQWMHNQIYDAPISSHRQYFRRHSSTRARVNKRHGITKHPCEPLTRWHNYAFTMVEFTTDYGTMDVDFTSDGSGYVLSVDGSPLTETDSVALIDYKDLVVPGSYELCRYLSQEYLGGGIAVMFDDVCRLLSGGNPRIHFSSTNPNFPQTVIDLPAKAKDDFIPVPGSYPESEQFLHPHGIHHSTICPILARGSFPVYLHFDDGDWLAFDPRLIVSNNTLEHPMLGGGGDRKILGSLCANAPRTFLNEEKCKLSTEVGACSNDVELNDIKIALNGENLSIFNVLTNKYVYVVDGLRAEYSPCVKEIRSRWARIHNDTTKCNDSTTPVTDDTRVTLANMIEEASDSSANLRDVLYQNDDVCDIPSSTATSQNIIRIVADSACWELMHTDHHSVYDFTPWVSEHPGGPDHIKKWADDMDSITLQFSMSHPMERWETHKDKLEYIGIYADEVPFRDLPYYLQTNDIIEALGLKGESSIKESVLICGSVNEVENDHSLGETGMAMTIRDGKDDVDYADKENQKKNLWTNIVLSADDQLRQRMAWAISQIFAISPNDVSFADHTEAAVNYYDIFVRHAFGNYFDILKEVSYSSIMAEMLTFLDSKSTAYMYKTDNVISFADENFAREIMQLFTMGPVLLNEDGTTKLDVSNNESILSYTNDHIMSFARVWTGFTRQAQRGNIELWRWHPNNVDPMRIVSEWRDVFPKIDLYEGFIGDSYPLCEDLPEKSFLRIGATYRLLGSSTILSLQNNIPSWVNYDPHKKKVKLDPSSQLYQKLCDPSFVDGVDCNYPSLVTLDSNIACNGLECDVDTLRMVEVTDNVWYEYVRQPCVELTFYKNAKTVYVPWKNIKMCANPRSIVAGEACCTETDIDYGHGAKCEYINERVTFSTAEKRCASLDQHLCPYQQLNTYSVTDGCRAYFYFYHWSGSSCQLQVKVEDLTGNTAVVHEPAPMIPGGSQDKSVGSDTLNFFPVYWESDNFPNAANSCGENACDVINGGCLCNVTVDETTVFSAAPENIESLLSSLSIGVVSPETFDAGTYDSPIVEGDIKVYFRSGHSYDIDTIFEVHVRGKKKYFKNMKSIVQVVDVNFQPKTYKFRNPPHFINFHEGDERDAHYETEAALQNYFEHPNVPPFLATYFIQRFGISNPSPRYVKEVVHAFKTGKYSYTHEDSTITEFGASKYGDLAATVAAVLLDREARSIVLDLDPTKGSLKEPLIKMIAFMRAMKLTGLKGYQFQRHSSNIREARVKIGQMAHDAPSIFSFFRREYTPNGPVQEASLVSPEAQRYVTPTVVGFMNSMFSLIKFGMSHCYGGFGKWMDGGCIEGSRKSAYGELTYKSTDPSEPSAVINDLALLLTAGRLNQVSRNIIANHYEQKMMDTNEEAALSLAQQLIISSPEFHSTGITKFSGKPLDIPDPITPSSRPYKAVIYLFLAGGMDSFNLLVPHSGCSRDLREEFETVRSIVAPDMGALNTIGTGGVQQVCNTFGIHKDLPMLKTLYDDEDLSFFANVGYLFEEVTKENWSEKTPTQLFAHNVQQRDVQQADPFKKVLGTGVLGRMADVLTSKGYKTGSFSLSGEGLSLRGEPKKSPDVNHISYDGVTTFNALPSQSDMTPTMFDLNNATTTSSNIYGKTWSSIFEKSVRQTGFLDDVLNDASPTVDFPISNLGTSLKTVSSIIQKRDSLGEDRHLFFVESFDWDTHTNQAGKFSETLPDLNNSLEAFVKEMKAQNIWESVTLVMASDFGRTLTPNGGKGTDHAWGGNYFVLGGGLDGGKILGKYPDDLTAGGPLNIGRGRLIPTTSWDAIMNAVSEWTGITDSEGLDNVLPNRNKFSLYSMNDVYN